MAQYNHTTVTRAGRYALANSLVNREPLHIIRMEVGQGDISTPIEDLTALVDKVADVPVTKYSSPSGGTAMIRGVFRNNDIPSDFKMREIGIIARSGEGEEVLFAYANAGDKADYIPVSSTLMEKVLTLSLVVGNADVLVQNIDPNAAATLEDIQSLKDELNIEELERSINDAKDELELIKKDIEENASSYIKRSGDSMSGDLEMIDGSQVNGSALMWNGWLNFDSFDELNAYLDTEFNPESGILEIFEKMPAKCRATAFISETSLHYPGIGLLEMQKGVYITTLLFTLPDGRAWKGTIYNGVWTGWGSSSEMPSGAVFPYLGIKLPLGYLWPHGQEIEVSLYPGLVEALDGVLSSYVNSVGKTVVRLPDLRGLFIRCLDNDAGIDLNRVILSVQASAAPNITGFVSGAMAGYYDGSSGAFRLENMHGRAANITGTVTYPDDFSFDASRVSSVYNSNVSEIRPRNIAANYILKY